MMLSCKDVTRLVSQGLDRELSLGERTMLRFHFAICAGCRNVNRQLALLRSAIRQLSEDEAKSPRG
ncbi:MAG TPA: zf-HC2 domain-containing protein [Burkholderiales bacterium]|nr:zf-HC2 domain-containing protein [Burkholderiales bacterium]